MFRFGQVAFVFLATSGPALSSTFTLNAFFDLTGTDGDQLVVGQASTGGDGMATIDTSVTLSAGSDTDEFTARPKVLVGDGAAGTLTITGATTVFDLNGTPSSGGTVVVGQDAGGNGTFTLDNGATLRLSGGDADGPLGNDLFLQTGTGAGTGVTTIDGATLEMSGYNLVGLLTGTGSGANGTLNIVNGSTVTVTHLGPGEAFVAGNQAYAVVGNGVGGVGNLLVEDSTVSFYSEDSGASIIVGRQGADGTALFTGATTLVTVDGGTEQSGLYIGAGNGSTGSATIENGARIELNGPTAQVAVGTGLPINGPATEDGDGTLLIFSGGQLVLAPRADGGTSVQVGAVAPGVGEANFGYLEVNGTGSLLSTSNNIQVGQVGGAGTTNAVMVVGNGGLVEANELRILDGGILTGSGGTIDATTIVETGGTLSPGSSPGVMTIAQDLVLSGGILDLEVSALESDLLHILGNLIIEEPSEIVISLLDGYVPSLGDSFDFFDIAGSIVGSVADLSVSIFGDGFLYSGGFAQNSLTIEVTGVSAVPVPAGLPLILTALGGLFLLGGTRRATV